MIRALIEAIGLPLAVLGVMFLSLYLRRLYVRVSRLVAIVGYQAREIERLEALVSGERAEPPDELGTWHQLRS